MRQTGGSTRCIGEAQQLRGIGAYSRPEAWARLDQRSSEARFLKRVRADLTKQVGKPSAVQVALIERAAMLSLHVAKLDEKMLAGGSMTEHDSKTYLAWSANLCRTLARLGLDGAAPEPVETVADIVARRLASRGVAA